MIMLEQTVMQSSTVNMMRTANTAMKQQVAAM
jgi:hypothetical protein